MRRIFLLYFSARSWASHKSHVGSFGFYEGTAQRDWCAEHTARVMLLVQYAPRTYSFFIAMQGRPDYVGILHIVPLKANTPKGPLPRTYGGG